MVEVGVGLCVLVVIVLLVWLGMVLHDFYFQVGNVLGRYEGELEVLPAACQFQPDLCEDHPYCVLWFVLPCVLDLDQFRVAVILVPTDETHPVEISRSLNYIPHVDDADGRQLLRQPNFPHVISEDVFGVVMVEGFGSG